MRHLLAFLLLCPLLVSGCSTRGSAPPHSLLEQKIDPVQYHPVSPATWQLDNGLTVMFHEDPELPLVWGTLYMKGGSLWELPGEDGVTGAMGVQLRQGGAGGRSADELDAELERLSASVGSGFGDEFGTVGFSCLASDFDRVFSIFEDVTLRPRFDSSRLDLWKGQTLEDIRRRVDDPHTIAGISFSQLLFGDTPYGRVLVESDLRQISRTKLLRAHRRLVRPNQAILAVTGKIDQARLKQAVAEAFGGWQARASELPPAPPVDFSPRPAIYFVEMPFEQSTVIMGHQGPQRLNADDISIKGFNRVFGLGGFSSKLMEQIRVKLGLAYSTYGVISPGVVKGQNLIVVQTKAASTVKALIEAQKVLRDLQEEEVTTAELDELKRATQNSFVFKFESPSEAVNRRAWLQLLDFPADYDDKYIGRILELTPSDIRQVAQKYWDLKKFVIVIVGNSRALALLKKTLADPPELLQGYQLKQVGFSQKLDSGS